MLASAPVLAVLVYFLVEAHRIRLDPSSSCRDRPAAEYEEDADAENEDADALCSDVLRRTATEAAAFLVVALLWSILAAYLTFYVPRRHLLLHAYLVDGVRDRGDVVVVCGGGNDRTVTSWLASCCFGRDRWTECPTRTSSASSSTVSRRSPTRW